MTPGTVKVFFKDDSWKFYDDVTACWVTPNTPPILVISQNNEETTTCFPLDIVEFWKVGKLPEQGDKK